MSFGLRRSPPAISNIIRPGGAVHDDANQPCTPVRIPSAHSRPYPSHGEHLPRMSVTHEWDTCRHQQKTNNSDVAMIMSHELTLNPDRLPYGCKMQHPHSIHACTKCRHAYKCHTTLVAYRRHQPGCESVYRQHTCSQSIWSQVSCGALSAPLGHVTIGYVGVVGASHLVSELPGPMETALAMFEAVVRREMYTRWVCALLHCIYRPG